MLKTAINCTLYFSRKKKHSFFMKLNYKLTKLRQIPTDYSPNFFWIVTVEDWTKTSVAIAVRPLRHLFVSNVIDIGNLPVKKFRNNCCVFDNL